MSEPNGTPNPNPVPPNEPNETDLDKVVARRVGAYAKRTHEAEAQRDEAVTRLQAEQAEKELLREENARLKLAKKELDLNTKFPLAAKHLSETPGLGLTADNAEDYEKKMEELNTYLAGKANPTPGTPPAGTPPTPPAPKGDEPKPGAPIVAPAGGAGIPTVPAENLNDIVKMPLSEYAKLPKEDRENLLRALDSQAPVHSSKRPR